MSNKIMEHKGFKAQIMEAPRLTGDMLHGLPPGTPLDVYPVDAFVKPPENWMTGPGNFVVPVRANKGLWFDWRGNSAINTAVIPTVKGCNPITGMQTSGFHLEKYETKCPKHGCDFLAERFCPECNYKWAPQGYISSPNMLWWDGFRADDGSVRQFFFTEDELRDVASGLIGKENTVGAFGFAFYSPKEPRPEMNYRGIGAAFGPGIITTHNTAYYNDIKYGLSTMDWHCATPTAGCEIKTSGGLIEKKFKHTNNSSVGALFCSTLHEQSLAIEGEKGPDIIALNSFGAERSRSVPVKEVSIGAGARINQTLNPDPYGLDTWKDTPDSVMTIYFVFQEMFEDIKARGLRDLTGVKDGFLSKCPVG